MARPIVITGGGTGGHIMPMVAIADALIALGVPPHEIVFVGSQRGQESLLLSERSERVVLLPGRGLRRSAHPRALVQNFVALCRLIVAMGRAISLTIGLRPRAVVSVGGYAAFPMVAASLLLRRSSRGLYLVELDAATGLVHRIARRHARITLFGIDPGHHSGPSEVVGVPLRESIVALTHGDIDHAHAKRERGIDPASICITVMTGSLGARRVNEAVVELAHRWRDRSDVVIYHVSGRRDFPAVSRSTSTLDSTRYHVHEFESNMASLWAATDIAVCRAGAATVAELSALGIPSVLIPLPGAPSDHQTKNAESLVAVGGAAMLHDVDCTPDGLAATLEPLIASSVQRHEMGRRAASAGRRDAARRIAEVIVSEWPPRHVHVVGAGGTGMSGVVRYFADVGSRVSGSDQSDSTTLRSLRPLGRFSVGSNTRDASRATLVTWSPAVAPETDRDIAAARGPLINRSDLLATVARHHSTLAVTGTHGKTTASSMLVHIARAAEWSPSWLVGAEIRGAGPNGCHDGDRLILELDESYGTFEKVIPHGLAVLNIDSDHLDHYGTYETLAASFRGVMQRTEGPVVIWSDDVPAATYEGLRVVTVGTTDRADYVVDRLELRPEGAVFQLRGPQMSVDISLRVTGHHNVANAATVAVLAHHLGATPSAITTGLARFPGAPRRYEHRGRLGTTEIIDDFAHLPGEIAATLRTARENGSRELLAVFQPHRYSRTHHLLDEFGASFGDATHVVVTDIYGAGERNDYGVSGQQVAEAISAHRERPVTYCHTLADVEAYVRDVAPRFDTVVFLGAGDIAEVVDALGGSRVD